MPEIRCRQRHQGVDEALVAENSDLLRGVNQAVDSAGKEISVPVEVEAGNL